MESIQRKQFNRYIEKFEFDRLFNQLGWNYVDQSFPKKAAQQTFKFQHIAEKAGFAILICQPDADGKIPDAQTRKRIHTEISKLHHEHLIIFIDKGKTIQQWELLVREPNKPARVVSHKWITGQAPELLYQKLSGAFFSIEEDEEGELTIIDVVQRIKENFGANAEKVTKKFYTEFKRQHSQFLDFIKGIDDTLPDKDNTSKQWYASLMLNRLMFCYFIQKKGFLDQDKHYLKNKLKACQELSGSDKFYSFYRSFLLELFHDGLGKPIHKRSDELPVELGKIPYLNGGLFDVHELERQFDKIQIDDDAFEHIFEFFDEWEWHLDTREHAEGKTINPDVIGYIFEKYINNRAAMGAYYTKEDITDYICKCTIVPFLFNETERHYMEGFNPGSELWSNLKSNGDAYFYNAVQYGVPEEGGLFDDLPEDVKAGFKPELEKQEVKVDTSPHLWEIRQPWNQRAPQEIGLPTELYREMIERRKRYAEIKGKIEKGEITHINDLITYNLDIRQFTQDFIERTVDPVFLQHFYRALNKVTILDPTCGSGAFLFAAMSILEPLYETCIKRMEEFTEEDPGKHKFFEETLEQVKSDDHPNLQYFIYKSIILNNLFGVDIMNEAVEIAKLRLFLKLVAVVDVEPDKKNYGLEPLPDIDFNIRAGNTLVGFATEVELLETIQKKDALFAQEKLDGFKEEFKLVAKAFDHFHNNQLINEQGGDNFRKAKAELNRSLKELNYKINVYLATNYGITDLTKEIEIELKTADGKKVKKKLNHYQYWLETHQPFNWFAEFYQIVGGSGGFDVIIGNPPYLEMRQINYKVNGLKTSDSNAVHSMCVERSLQLLNDNSSISMIVPLSLVCTQRMTVVQNLLENHGTTWYSNYSWRPGKLFDQVNRALTIFCSSKSPNKSSFSTGYLKWNAEHRDFLMPTLNYVEFKEQRNSFWYPKLSKAIEKNILKKVLSKTSSIPNFLGQTKNRVYYRTTGGLYWKVFTDFSPKFYLNGNEGNSSRETSFSVIGENKASQIVGLLSSSTFWWWYTLTSNLRDLNPSDIYGLSFGSDLLDQNMLLVLSQEYLVDLKSNSKMLQREQKNKGLTETQSFKISKSKTIIDQIDTVIAQHYGFTEVELDFIINYDIKYRMGKALYGGKDNGEEED